MIVAVSDSKVLRQQFEDEFVVRLKELGVDAVASIEYFPDDDLLTEKQLKTENRNRLRMKGRRPAARQNQVESLGRCGSVVVPLPSLAAHNRVLVASRELGNTQPM